MATITHAKVLSVPDSAQASAAGEALPSDWNADHVDASGNPLTVRTILTGNITYYVSVIGSDSNDGSLANPWATLQHATDVVATTLDTAGFIVTISIGAGSFAGVGCKPIAGGGVMFFQGAGPASTTITAGPNDGTFNLAECFSGYVPLLGNVFIDNLFVDGTGSGPGNGGVIFFQAGNILHAADANNIFTSNIKYAGIVGNWIVALINAVFYDGSVAEITTAAGSCDGFINPDQVGGAILGATYTLTGTPAWSIGFVGVSNGGTAEFFGSFSGSATGPQYNLNSGGTINNHGITFPGNAAGVMKDDCSFGNNVFTVATLPNPVGSQGATANVTDSTVSLAAGLGNIVAGPGGNFTPVYSDDTNWRIG